MRVIQQPQRLTLHSPSDERRIAGLDAEPRGGLGAAPGAAFRSASPKFARCPLPKCGLLYASLVIS